MKKLAKKGKSTTKTAARRIQSSQDKKGSTGDQGFKARTTRAAQRNTKK